MTQFSALLKEKLQRGEYKEGIEVVVNNPGNFDLVIIKDNHKDEPCYTLMGSYRGTKKTSLETTSSNLVQFIKSTKVGLEDWSTLQVFLEGNERIGIDHYKIEGRDLNFYHVTLLFPEADNPRRIRKVLSQIADEFYGLTFNPRINVSEMFNNEEDDLSRGIFISSQEQLKYGSLLEKKARTIIQHQNLTAEEKKILKLYDSALVKPRPETRKVSVYLLQKRPAWSAKRFASLFEHQPKNVENISLFIDGSMFVGLSDLPDEKSGQTPYVSVSHHSLYQREIYHLAYLLLAGYHSLTGLSMEEALKRKIK